MSSRIVRETFFRPEELAREELAIPAVLYNRCRLLHTRAETPHLFVPIRSMQFLAVVEQSEIIFVDNQGGYAVQDGEGGRLITLAWQFDSRVPRESLSEPVAMALVHYAPQVNALHRRIMSELPAALSRLEQKRDTPHEAAGQGRVIPFRSA